MISSLSSQTSSLVQSYGSTTAAQRHKEMFTQLDSNNDGKVDTLELSSVVSKNSNGPDAATLMKQMDTDGDGTISESENETFLSAMDDARQAGAQSTGAAAGGRPSGPPPAGGGTTAAAESDSTSTQVYDKLDTNKDGKVSFEELMAGLAKAAAATGSSAASDTSSATTVPSASDAKAEELFKKVDSNSDGSIDKNEFDAFKTKMDEAIRKQKETAATFTAQGQLNYDSVGSAVNTLA